MIKEVIFVCISCEDINNQMLGTDNFIVRDTEFYSLTDANEHLNEYKNRKHLVIGKVVEHD